MASQSESATAVTAAYIARQQLLMSVLARDLIRLIGEVFKPSSPGSSWSATKLALDGLIRDRRRMSADLAARYYVDVRQASLTPARRQRAFPARTEPQPAPALARTPAEPATAEPELSLEADLEDFDEESAWAELEKIAPVEPGDLDDDRLDSNLNATGIGSYQRALRAGQTPAKAVDTMAMNLTGSATTLTLEGGREIVRAAAEGDDEAIGWLRVTDADPCSWCSMLASRVAVYRSAGTAGREINDRFTGEGQFKWHDHCGCNAIPVFDPDDPHVRAAEDLYDQWLRETQGHSGKAAVNAWRRYWENREQPN